MGTLKVSLLRFLVLPSTRPQTLVMWLEILLLLLQPPNLGQEIDQSLGFNSCPRLVLQVIFTQLHYLLS